MFRDRIEIQHRQYAPEGRRSWSLQLVLWSVWTAAVAVVAYMSWHADRLAHHPVNLAGLAIHCVLTGLVGLVVLTMIEMRVEPWRFRD